MIVDATLNVASCHNHETNFKLLEKKKKSTEIDPFIKFLKKIPLFVLMLFLGQIIISEIRQNVTFLRFLQFSIFTFLRNKYEFCVKLIKKNYDKKLTLLDLYS
ncbi:hypothetical protein BpHYR1_021406 [Brachionus plicatilis]|uniref:Uncharacterized protein n=1 Tax=Brachionus plicatilis TaxID=10195 RepID=A0A3M7PZ79_BRAPC|nr:hypothetical protein BpHYR1_021406 [Brachionus plicatilis]